MTQNIKKPLSTEKPTSLVIFLHGYGSNGADLIGLANVWADMLPETVFVSPDAPDVCDESAFGFQWFSLGDWSIATMLKGAQNAHAKLDAYIKSTQQEYDIKPENTVLVGFSQGTMMALYTGLRQEQRLAGILGYSGALLGAEELAQVKTPKPPICLIHGDADTVVPVVAYDYAMAALKMGGYEVDGLRIPRLTHGIDDTALERGQEFLVKVLGV